MNDIVEMELNFASVMVESEMTAAVEIFWPILEEKKPAKKCQ